MVFPFARIVAAVLAVSVALFLLRLFFVPAKAVPASRNDVRKNYASVKVSVSGQPVGASQKYEKIASVTQMSDNFDADRR